MDRVVRYPLLVVYTLCFYAVFVLVRLMTVLGFPRRRESKQVKRVLFLECMGPPSAGYRHRSKGWVDVLNANGFTAECWFVLPYTRQWQLQQSRNGVLLLHLIYLFRRLVQCFRSAGFDAVIVRRELLLYNDYGDLFFEKWMSRMHSRLILDADDDISAAKREPREIGAFGKLLMEHPSKFKASLRYFDKAIVGSDYLRGLFASWNNGLVEQDIVVIPACVDYYKRVLKSYDQLNSKITLGWAGSAYSLRNLYTVYPALEAIAKNHDIELLVICNEPPKPANLPVVFVPWSEENELDNLLKMDIGLMPLVDSDVSKGKGGLKLIQYMGCGIVSVASAVTVNKDIVEDGVNGFLVSHQADWQSVLEHVLQQKTGFGNIGAQAAKTVQQRYSYDARLADFLSALSVTPVSETIKHRVN